MSDGMHNEINYIGEDEPSEVDPAATCSPLSGCDLHRIIRQLGYRLPGLAFEWEELSTPWRDDFQVIADEITKFIEANTDSATTGQHINREL